SRSYSTGTSWPKSRPWSSKKSSPKPAKAKDEKAPPPEKVNVVSNSGGFRESIAVGFNWGFGNAMGHRFVEAIFGPRTIRTETVVPKKDKEVATVSALDDNEKLKDYSETCSISYNAFQDCLNVEGNNLSKCHLFMDSLFECKRNSSSFNL
ncbi:hypothetical protein CARUB_v10021103mg, partial [Capsella rubella]